MEGALHGPHCRGVAGQHAEFIIGDQAGALRLCAFLKVTLRYAVRLPKVATRFHRFISWENFAPYPLLRLRNIPTGPGADPLVHTSMVGDRGIIPY